MASASSRSWVTYTEVMSSRRWSSFSSTRISARSLASRFDSGSSKRSTEGEKTKARASATRCCWPPESLAALRRAEVAQLDQVERLAHARRHLGVRPLPHPQAVGDVVEHAHVRPDGVRLEDHRQAAVARRERSPARRTRRPGCRRSGSRPTPGAPARRWPAASSSCRSPRGRAGSGARPRRRRSVTPRTATTAP